MASIYATSASFYVYATATWDSNLNVTVTIDSANTGWCVKIRGTSTIKCQGSSSDRTGTFTADYDGQQFVLQVYDREEEQFSNNGNPFFTVSNNGGGSGSGGGSSDDDDNSATNYRSLYVDAGFGTSVSVTIIDMNNNIIKPRPISYDGMGHGTYFSVFLGGCHRFDRLKIEVSALDGFELNPYYGFNYHVEGANYDSSDGTWDLSYHLYGLRITTSATPLYDNSTYHLYAISDDTVNKIKISRTYTTDSAVDAGSYLGELTTDFYACCNGYSCARYPIWTEDRFTVQPEFLDGFTLHSFECNGMKKIANSNEYYFASPATDAEIVVLSTEGENPDDDDLGGDDITDVRTAGNGIFIDDVKYRGYIDNGTGWDLIGRVLRKSGTCITDSNGEVSFVDVGFTPDAVVFLDPGYTLMGNECYCPATAVFSEMPPGSIVAVTTWAYDENGNDFDIEMYLSPVENGFCIHKAMYHYGYDDSSTELAIYGLNYIAIKYN